QRRIDRHRVVLLRSREGEEDHHHRDPAQSHQACTSSACARTVTQSRSSREKCRPGKQPNQIQEPEERARNRVVVARVTQVEEAQQVLVKEIEPEEAAIFAWSAMKGEREIRWIVQRGKDVPWACDQERDCSRGEHVETLPSVERQ